ncbi:MAG: sialidase family protein [Bryobacteraceae bacterium]
MRTFALAWACVAALCAQVDRGFETILAPSTEANRRNSEADILALPGGDLLLAWTEFYTAQGSDWGSARLASRRSRDGGRTWSAKTVLQENIGAMNVMEPDLLRLRSGKVLFAFARKNSEADCAPMIRVSVDGAKSFGPPKPIPIDPSPSYTGMNNDRMIQLSSGRVVLPLWYTSDYRVDRHIRTRIYFSDDEGATWQRSRTLVDVPDSKPGAQEPGVVELKDGRLLLWVRTGKGRIYRALSADRGETWTQPEPMDLESPLAPQTIKRIPSTGDLLLVWNKSESKRTPLTAAISSDDGETWAHFRNLEDAPDRTYAYTSIEFHKESKTVLLTYYVGPGREPGQAAATGWSLKLKVLPVGWFYQ